MPRLYGTNQWNILHIVMAESRELLSGKKGGQHLQRTDGQSA